MTTSDDATGTPEQSGRSRVLHRVALVQAVVLLAAVLLALPFAFRSMGIQLTERQARTLYEFPDGQPATAVMEDAVASAESFLNLAIIELDEGAGSVTIAVSGHRNCPEICAELDLTLFSLDDDADVRRALPPSVPLKLDPSLPIFSQTVQLPIRGQPSTYPFDDYLLWLGLGGTATLGNQTIPLTEDLVEERAVFTVQNQLRDFIMRPPVQIETARAQGVTDPIDFVGVQALTFQRPVHLKILAVLLITLITVSAVIAVSMREVSDLVVGIGSLVLGIWGVRSILVPQPVPVVTSIDLALSLVILLVLLGLSFRVALHFRKTADLPAVTIPKTSRIRVNRRTKSEGE